MARMQRAFIAPMFLLALIAVARADGAPDDMVMLSIQNVDTNHIDLFYPSLNKTLIFQITGNTALCDGANKVESIEFLRSRIGKPNDVVTAKIASDNKTVVAIWNVVPVAAAGQPTRYDFPPMCH